MATLSHAAELNSELALRDFYLHLPDLLHRTYENACCIDIVYVPKYDALIKCVADALVKQQSEFGNWESCERRVLVKTLNNKRVGNPVRLGKNLYQNKTEFVVHDKVADKDNMYCAICEKKANYHQLLPDYACAVC